MIEFKILADGSQIPTIGLGTWNIGGGMTANRQQDKESTALLERAIQMGYTHIDTAEMYGGGHTEELVGQAIRLVNRQNLFITTKVSPSNLRYRDILKALDGSLKRLGTDYVDLYLIHWPNDRIPLEESFRALNEGVRSGKTRYLGVSNFDVLRLKAAEGVSETRIITNQVPYSLQSREYVTNGTLSYCRGQGILITAYSPIKTVNLQSQTLKEMAGKYHSTPAQLALYWVIQQPGVIAIPKSINIERLKENLQSRYLEVSPEDLIRLDRASSL